MTREEAEIYAKTMTYEDALYNLSQARAIPYRKATFIKVNELIQALSQESCTDIPDNATNGNSVIKMFFKGIVRISSRKNVSVEFNKNWWNAPYQKGGKE